jgi:hypothetical protein
VGAGFSTAKARNKDRPDGARITAMNPNLLIFIFSLLAEQDLWV